MSKKVLIAVPPDRDEDWTALAVDLRNELGLPPTADRHEITIAVWNLRHNQTLDTDELIGEAIAKSNPAKWEPVPRQLPVDRERLGQIVREAWIKWARQQPSPRPSWLVPWEGLSEPDKEVDRQIGEAVASATTTLIGELLDVQRELEKRVIQSDDKRERLARELEITRAALSDPSGE